MTPSDQESKLTEAKSAARDVADHTRSTAAEVTDTAKDEARSVAQDARQQASNVLSTARTELRQQAQEQTRTLASTLHDVGRQLGGMADSSEQPQAQVPALARAAADRLRHQAERLDDGGLDGLVADLKRFARNRPAAFLVASAAAGFGIGRLAKHADLGEIAEQVKDEVSGASGSSADSSDSPSDPPLEPVSAPAVSAPPEFTADR